MTDVGFSATLDDTQETEILEIEKEEGLILGDIYVDLEEFNSNYSSSDDLTFRTYIKNNDGNMRQVESERVVSGGDFEIIRIEESITANRRIVVKAQLSSHSADILVFGHYEEFFDADLITNDFVPDGVLVYDSGDERMYWKARLESGGRSVDTATRGKIEVFNHQNTKVMEDEKTSHSSEGVFGGNVEVNEGDLSSDRPGYFRVTIEKNGEEYTSVQDFFVIL